MPFPELGATLAVVRRFPRIAWIVLFGSLAWANGAGIDRRAIPRGTGWSCYEIRWPAHPTGPCERTEHGCQRLWRADPDGSRSACEPRAVAYCHSLRTLDGLRLACRTTQEGCDASRSSLERIASRMGEVSEISACAMLH